MSSTALGGTVLVQYIKSYFECSRVVRLSWQLPRCLVS